MIICAGESESFEFAKPIGIGLINSAINLTKILLTNKQNELVFIGTAGLYYEGKILEIYESSTAYNLEISKVLELSYSPLIEQNRANVSRETLAINSSNFITTDRNCAIKFSQIGLFMENMEFYAVKEVAKKFNIPCYAILCATNFCNQNAHQDFIKNHSAAKEKLKNYLKERDLI